MSLPTTITTTAHGVFTSAGDRDGKHTYYAPSPQGDLKGRPMLVVSHQVSNAGIRGSLVSLVDPVYDATSGEYTGTIKDNDVITRNDLAPTAAVADVQASLKEVLATAGFTAAIAASQL